MPEMSIIQNGNNIRVKYFFGEKKEKKEEKGRNYHYCRVK